MKPILRTIILIVTVMLIVSCSENDVDDQDNMMDDKMEDMTVSDFVDINWQIITINGMTLEQIFTPAPIQTHEVELTIGENIWVFDADGSLTGSIKFILTEKYTEPESSSIYEVTITSEGMYTAEDTSFEITKQDIKVDVDVSLEPKEVWEIQLGNPAAIERVEADLALESKNGLEQETLGSFFKERTDYTWRIEEDRVIVSTAILTIIMEQVE